MKFLQSLSQRLPFRSKSFNFKDKQIKQTGEKLCEADNYDIAEKKIEIKISAGVSNVSVLRK